MSTKKLWQGTAVAIALLLAAGLGLLAGCGDSSKPDYSEYESVQGVIVSIGEEEMVLDVSWDSLDFLSGTVRAGITGIDAELLETLRAGDEVTVYYSGVVGRSDPPFIAALAIELVE